MAKNGVQVAKAIVTVIPSAEGARKKIQSELTSTVTSAAGDAGKSGGKKMGEALSEGASSSVKKSLPNSISSGLSSVKSMISSTFGKIFHNGITEAVPNALSSGMSTMKLAIGNALGNVFTGAIQNAAGTIKDTLTSAFNSYADYQQLEGGVQTLFKDSSGIVMENAKKAFRDAGMSANDYMETVTSFSASLISSLGGDTAKAADVANTALVDMSDNANKMGTDMSLLQNAYQGFAKQNYTMLFVNRLAA